MNIEAKLLNKPPSTIQVDPVLKGIESIGEGNIFAGN